MMNKLRALGRSLLLDVGLRSKLLCIFFMLLALPLGIFTVYAFHRINTVIEEQTFSAAQKSFEDTHNAVEDLFGRITQVADVLTMDPTLYSMAASDPAPKVIRPRSRTPGAPRCPRAASWATPARTVTA